MLLFYVRHGDPIYDPDSLTEQGKEQANALVKRMESCRPEVIYASSSNRAIMTAEPTAKALGLNINILDWCNEGYTWQEFSYPSDSREARWLFQHPKAKQVLASSEVRRLDSDWYKHPYFSSMNKLESGINRMRTNVDAFMSELGYIRKDNGYEVQNPKHDRVALFAHQGFGLSFLSTILDIPYPTVASRLDMGHTGMSVIYFEDTGFTVPKLLQLSNDSHLFAADINTVYNNIYEF